MVYTHNREKGLEGKNKYFKQLQTAGDCIVAFFKRERKSRVTTFLGCDAFDTHATFFPTRPLVLFLKSSFLSFMFGFVSFRARAHGMHQDDGNLETIAKAALALGVVGAVAGLLAFGLTIKTARQAKVASGGEYKPFVCI